MTSAQAKVNPRHPDPEVVRKAEAIFAKLGITPEEAVNILYKQTVLHGAFPISDLGPTKLPRTPSAKPGPVLTLLNTAASMK